MFFIKRKVVMKHYYVVPVFITSFSSLEDAKWNLVVSLTKNEAKRYLYNDSIFHYVGDRLHSVTPINVDEDGNISFGKTRRV